MQCTRCLLEFLKNRLSNNIIFVTNIAKNLPGKRYIEIIRQIYGFNIIVLFFLLITKSIINGLKIFQIVFMNSMKI